MPFSGPSAQSLAHSFPPSSPRSRAGVLDSGGEEMSVAQQGCPRSASLALPLPVVFCCLLPFSSELTAMQKYVTFSIPPDCRISQDRVFFCPVPCCVPSPRTQARPAVEELCLLTDEQMQGPYQVNPQERAGHEGGPQGDVVRHT